MTGLGIVSPLGLDVGTTWQALLSAQSGVGLLERADPLVEQLDVHLCAKVKNFDPTVSIAPKDLKKMGAFIQYALVASQEAVLDAGFSITDLDPVRCGVAVGSGMGGLEVITQNYARFTQFGPKRVSPFFIPASIINLVSGQISMQYGLQGPIFLLLLHAQQGYIISL